MGGGATGSRLVTGTTELHGELERELADFCGFESALVFSSGYAANLAAVTALAPHGSLVVSDAGNHASLIDGCRLAAAPPRSSRTPTPTPYARRSAPTRARRRRVRHGLLGGRGRGAAGRTGRRLPGVRGRTDRRRRARTRRAGRRWQGRAARGGACGRPGRRRDRHALQVVRQPGRRRPRSRSGHRPPGQRGAHLHLRHRSRARGGGAALAALRLLRREPERAARARAVATALHTRLTAEGLEAVRPDAAVVSVRAPSPERAVRWAADCREAGLAVGCFRPRRCPTASHG